MACAGAGPGALIVSSDGRYVMGTVLEMTVYGRDSGALRLALDALFAKAQWLDTLLTTYDPASDISRVNRSAGRGPQAVDAEVTAIVSRSVEYARLTRGSFDVTIGPLVALWVDAAARGELPASDDLARARARVGVEGVRVHGDGAVELAREGMSLELGGIAKGYALDRMRPLLREHGIEHALLNFGQSSTLALGAPTGSPGWRLLARGPGDGFLGVLTLRDQALSVSGSLGQFVEIGGRRYGHVLDPRSGSPLTRRRQALVVAPSAALAEALSKALLILGEGEGVALVTGQAGCEGLLVDAGGGDWRTPGWDAAVSFEPATSSPRSSVHRRPPMRRAWNAISAAPSAAPTFR